MSAYYTGLLVYIIKLLFDRVEYSLSWRGKQLLLSFRLHRRTESLP
jgi:hypothetical protein